MDKIRLALELLRDGLENQSEEEEKLIFEAFEQLKSVQSLAAIGSGAEPVGTYWPPSVTGKGSTGRGATLHPAPTEQNSKSPFYGLLKTMESFLREAQASPDFLDPRRIGPLLADVRYALTFCKPPAPAAQDSKVPEAWKLIPIEPTTDALYALAKVDGYLRGDRDMPGLTRWEDYYRAIYAVLSAQYVAEKPQLSAEDLQIIRQWYNCVSDLNPKYLNNNGFDDASVIRKVSALIDDGLQRPQPPEEQ